MRLFLYKGPVTPIALPNEDRRKEMWRAMDDYAKAEDPVLRSV